MKKIHSLNLTATKAKEQIASIAKHSEHIFLTKHAEERMQQRKITMTQIRRCLCHGRIVEGPYRDPYGDWKVTMETLSAGDPIKVTAVIQENKNGALILVITAYV